MLRSRASGLTSATISGNSLQYLTSGTFAQGQATYHVEGNELGPGHTSYVTDYTGGGYDLTTLIASNSFSAAPAVGIYLPGWTATTFPAVVP